MSSFASCSGEISTESGFPMCSGVWEAVYQAPPFDPSQLDPILVGQAFGSGFTLVTSFMLLAIGCRAVLNFIKTS